MTSCVIPRPAADEYFAYYGKYIAQSPMATSAASSRTSSSRRSP